MTRPPIARMVETLADNPAIGDVIVTGATGGSPPPANGMTAQVHLGDNAFSRVLNPLSSENGGLEWALRYGSPESVRYVAASVIASYDYLLSGVISFEEAARRLRILRAARRVLSKVPNRKDAQ